MYATAIAQEVFTTKDYKQMKIFSIYSIPQARG